MMQQQFPFALGRAKQRILYFCELHVSLGFDGCRRHLGNVGRSVQLGGLLLLTEGGDIFGGLLVVDLHLLLQFVTGSRSRSDLRVDNHWRSTLQVRRYDVGALHHGSLRHATWHHNVHVGRGLSSFLLLLITVLVLLLV